MSNPRLLNDLRGDPPEIAGPESRDGTRILHALRRILRAVDLYSRRLVAEHQITSPQLTVLYAIVEKGPLCPTDLGYAVQMTTTTVLRILDRLESQGFVRRVPVAGDPRRYTVAATETGRELAAKDPCSSRHPLHQGLQQFPPHERRQLTELLEQLVERMDARQMSVAPLVEVPALGRAATAVALQQHLSSSG